MSNRRLPTIFSLDDEVAACQREIRKLSGCVTILGIIVFIMCLAFFLGTITR